MLRDLRYSFPDEKSIRVIAVTDAYNEADDQYALAHMLMTPKFDIKAIVATHFGKENSEKESYEEILTVMRKMDLIGAARVLHGSQNKIIDKNEPVVTEGSRFIVEEALRDDPRPLFVAAMGAHTDIAIALLSKPEIAERICVISIGGCSYPKGGWEYNYLGDIKAIEVIMASRAEVWQVPKNVYNLMTISYFELLNEVSLCGDIGCYLVERTFEFSKKHHESAINSDGSWRRDEVKVKDMSLFDVATRFAGDLWCLGDSPCVGLMLNHNLGAFHEEKAPFTLNENGEYIFKEKDTRLIRVYDDIEARFIIEDMKAKLKYHYM